MTGWPADKVERRPVAALVPYARNARTHSDEQVAQIAGSIKEWGWTTPVLIDEADGIIALHGRVLAAQKLGLVDVPVVVARGWSEAQRRAYVLADNKLGLNAGWDLDLMKFELDGLKGLDFDLGLVGFSLDELDEMFAPGDPGGTGAGSLAERFMVAPFSVLNAREGWWQKRAWLALGIQSELGRGERAAIGGSPMPLDRAKAAAPGGSPRPAADYGKSHARGDGAGRAINVNSNAAKVGGGMCERLAPVRRGNG